MMMSPESFRESLEGKSAEEIQKEINSLRREIDHNKKILEGRELPDDSEDFMITDPGPDVIIKCDRKYLCEAIIMLSEAGGEYVPSHIEEKDDAFQETIPDIESLTLKIGGWRMPEEEREHTLKVVGEQVLKIDGWGNCEVSESFTPESFYDFIEGLHLGEWKKTYHNPAILDGTQWTLTVNYRSSIETKEFWGSNAYPYNFDELKEAFSL